MKLKYYMRGLGIGIILTTLILTLSHKEITDQEIINKAMNLGMVMKEDPEGNLDEVYANMDSENSPEQEEASDSENLSVGNDTNTEEEADSPDKTGTTEASTDEPVQKEETASETPTDDPVQSADLTEETATEASGTITFTINKGMSSNKVSIMLESLGLIRDSRDFNNYILGEGKAEVIRIGTYSLPVDATYQQILETITAQ